MLGEDLCQSGSDLKGSSDPFPSKIYLRHHITACAVAEVSRIYSRSKAISFTHTILNAVNKHLRKRLLIQLLWHFSNLVALRYVLDQLLWNCIMMKQQQGIA